MFTGIIDHIGTLENVQRIGGSLKLNIATRFTDLQPGESIAINGICLTVSEVTNTGFTCDVSSETMSCTTLATTQPSQAINLERALRAGDAIGGHLVSGHIDQTVRVHALTPHDGFMTLEITGIAPHATAWLIEKGSITLNGVSLTVNATFEANAIVMLIPETLERTNLGRLNVGDYLNVEFDMIGKYVARQAKLTTPHTQTVTQK